MTRAKNSSWRNWAINGCFLAAGLMVGLKGSNVSQLVPRGEDGLPVQATKVEAGVEAESLDAMETSLAGDNGAPLKSNANEATSQKELAATPDKSDIAKGVENPKDTAITENGKVAEESKAAEVAASTKDLGKESEIKDPAAQRNELAQKPASAKTSDHQVTAQTAAGRSEENKTPDHESVAVDKSDEAAAIVRDRTAAVEPSASALTKEDMRVQKRRIEPRTPTRLPANNRQQNRSAADVRDAVVDRPLGPAEAGESNIPRQTSPAVVRREDPPIPNATRETTGARVPATTAAATNPARRAVDMPRNAATADQPTRRPPPRRTEPAPRRRPAAIAETNVPRTSPRPSANRPANRTPATPMDSTVRRTPTRPQPRPQPRSQTPTARTPRVVENPSRPGATSRPQYRPSRVAQPAARSDRPQVEQIPIGDPEIIRVQSASRGEPIRPVSAASGGGADRDDKEREEAVQEIENELQRLQRALQKLQRN